MRFIRHTLQTLKLRDAASAALSVVCHGEESYLNRPVRPGSDDDIEKCTTGDSLDDIRHAA